MKITIDHLRAAGISDKQIVMLMEEREAEAREKHRQRQRKYLNKINNRVTLMTSNDVTIVKPKQNQQSRDVNDGDIGDILTTLPSSITTLEKEERSEIVALAAGKKYPPAFEEFYRQYPRHEGKRDALKVWLRVTKSEVTNVELIAGALRYAADPNRDPAFTKHCATWLSKGCWADAPLPPRGGQDGRGRQGEDVIEQGKRLADEWRRRERAKGIS